MKITKLYNKPDGKAYFAEMSYEHVNHLSIGHHTKKFPASGITFRDFEAGMMINMHNAPQPQYVIYLEGEVEVETSGGEKQIFKAGDILYALDVTGGGHLSRTLTNGRAVIIPSEPEIE